MEERRLLPPLDLDAAEHALFLQLQDAGTSFRNPDAEVVGDVGDGSDAERTCADLEQLAVGVLDGGFRGVEVLGRDDAFRDVVAAFEPDPLRRRHLAGPEQVLDGDLAVLPVPAPVLAGAFPRIVELADRDRSVLADVIEDALHVVGPFPDHPRHAAPRVALAGARHVPPKQRVQPHRNQRRLVAPVLEQLPVLVRHVVEELLVIGAQPGERRHVMRALERIHGVDLDQPHAVDHAPKVPPVHLPGGLGIGEPLRGERDPAYAFDREGVHRRPQVTGPDRHPTPDQADARIE